MQLLLLLPLFLLSCSSKGPAPEPEILPCYKAKTFAEYDKLSLQRIRNPDKPLLIKGKKYACVESGITVEAACYKARSKKEFARLSKLQEKGKGRPVKVAGKYYSCLQD